MAGDNFSGESSSGDSPDVTFDVVGWAELPPDASTEAADMMGQNTGMRASLQDTQRDGAWLKELRVLMYASCSDADASYLVAITSLVDLALLVT
ncbi:hypothetical protein ACOMHN_042654 [Nucella lapillus]